MTISQITNGLIAVTLIEMMVAIGLGVTLGELLDVARNWRLMAKAALANYLCVPGATLGLLLLFGTPPMAATGFLILAVCPGAPFGPPIASIARGNVPVAVGLMVMLAGSSALIAPLLLGLLLPLIAGDEPLHVDTLKIVTTLLITQLVPLCVGLAIRHFRPTLALRLMTPANLLGKILGLLLCGLILVTQLPTLVEIRLASGFGMLVLLLASFGSGWMFGGPDLEIRKTLTLTTSLRNAGVGLVIATGSFADTPAVTATLAYAVFEVLGSLLLALWWSKKPATTMPSA